MESLEPVTTIDPTKPVVAIPANYEPVKTIQPVRPTSLEEELREIDWVRKQDGFSGPIRGNHGTYDGYLYNVGGGVLHFFIRNPPQGFLRGTWSTCIQKRQWGWYYINFIRGNSQIERIWAVQEYLRQTGG